MKCPHCKAKIEKHSKFCEKCGKPVKIKRRKKMIICGFIVITIVCLLLGMYLTNNQCYKNVPSLAGEKSELESNQNIETFLNEYLEQDEKKIFNTAESVATSSTEIPIPNSAEAPTLSETETPISTPEETPTPSPTETPTLSPTEAPTPSPTEIPTPMSTEMPISESTEATYANSLEEKIQHIRDVYYSTQENLELFRADRSQEGLEIYYDEDSLKKIVSINGTCNNSDYLLPEGYSAEFYYENNTLVFVFVYQGSEEYRYYIDSEDENKCIRYIGPDGIVQDFEEPVFFVEYFGEMGKFCEAGSAEPYWLGLKTIGG